ncbi:hypothetical protein N8K70_10960 [Microbacterium betulae]|uniref:WxL domain-containing protein n=1 Tax=Microbacterium betulae TaxID=2981139 RepID=A0AA97FFW6_9MICO|nr:hypothetical protein [Microbacterium sp. AB]WOF21903.1 hypothetical protein N8K70_10960 [Microbacterium sp. AB]
MRKPIPATLGALAAVALLGVGAQTAAADDQDTPVTAEVAAGALAITAPAALDLGSNTPGTTANASLDAVTVTDERADVLGWVTSVSISDFTGANVSGSAIPVSGFTYVPSTATTSGTVTVVAATATGAGPSTVQTATGVTGVNTASWTADVTLVIPSDALADEYSATLTHSVI